MQIVLLRVGIDSGSGGIQGPLFRDGSFEFVPIPDRFGGAGVDKRTYGTTKGSHGLLLVDYFPWPLREKMRDQPIHFDPEFETFTYGDPTSLKARLRRLKRGDLLVFYAGLKQLGTRSKPGLYIIGYFEVLVAGWARDFNRGERQGYFSKNFHVRHPVVFRSQEDRLVLVKGTKRSRLLEKARLLSSWGRDLRGRPLKVLSRRMQTIFGGFGGHIGIQRSSPRWVTAEFAARAARFVRSLQ